MTLRCALYVCYSSGQQRAASIEGRFCICREHAGREGWKIVGTCRDSAISGDSVILRPGIQGADRGLIEARGERGPAERGLSAPPSALGPARLRRVRGPMRRRPTGSTAGDRRELAAIGKKIASMIAAIEDGGCVRGMSARLRELEARQDGLTALLAAVPADLPDIRPNVAAICRHKVECLAEALKRPAERTRRRTP